MKNGGGAKFQSSLILFDVMGILKGQASLLYKTERETRAMRRAKAAAPVDFFLPGGLDGMQKGKRDAPNPSVSPALEASGMYESREDGVLPGAAGKDTHTLN